MGSEPRDLRSTRRIATAFCVVAAPVLVGISRALIPTEKGDKATTAIPAVVAHLGQARAELVFTVLAALVLPFFVLGLYRITARRAPLLAGVGGVIALVGWTIGGPIEGAGHALAYELAIHGGNPASYDQFLHNGAINTLTVVFIVGHVLGTLLLGIALWRTRVVPTWGAGAVIVGIVGHLMATPAGSRGLDIASFAILIAGCAAVAATIVRTSDDNWDLAPDRSGSGGPAASVPRSSPQPVTG